MARQGGGGRRRRSPWPDRRAGAGAARRSCPSDVPRRAKLELLDPGRRRGPVGRRRDHPGPGRLRRQPAPDPGRQHRRGPGRRRPGPDPLQRDLRGHRRHRHADRLRDAWPAPSGFELFDAVDVEEVARTAARRALTKLSARPAPVRRGAGRAGRRERRHPLPRGVRARPRGRPHREGRLGLRRARSASRWRARSSPWSTTGPWAASGAHFADRRRGPARPRATCSSRTACSPTTCGTGCGPARRAGRRRATAGARATSTCPMVRMTNTFLLAGDRGPRRDRRPDARRASTWPSSAAARSTPPTGDFVFGTTEAYLIEDGQITEPLRDANLIGNGPEVLRRIDAVANDFAMTPGHLRQGRPERARSAAARRRCGSPG